MTIKRKIQIINTLPLLLAVAIMLVLLSSYAIISKIMKQDMIATEVMKEAFELDILTTEYMMNPAVRPKKQWLLKYSLINDLINTIEPDKVDDKRLLAKVRREHDGMKDLFQDLTDLYEKQKPSQEKTLVPAGYENKLREHLLIRSHSLASDAAYMSDVNHSSLMNHFRQVRIITVSSVIFMMIIMVAVSVVFGRSIIEPITKLRQATDVIAGGDLDYRVGIETLDEIGLLSSADAQIKKIAHNP
jgi:methyl-accepting chemotaxis protein